MEPWSLSWQADSEPPGKTGILSRWTSLMAQNVRRLPATRGDPGSISGSGRFPWRRKRQPTSCQDGEAWRTTTHGVAESNTTESERTSLSDAVGPRDAAGRTSEGPFVNYSVPGCGHPGTEGRPHWVKSGRRPARQRRRRPSPRRDREGEARWRRAGAGRSECGPPGMPRVAQGFRLWAVRGVGCRRRPEAGFASLWELCLHFLGAFSRALECSGRRRGRNKKLQGPARADPLVSQCERLPEPPLQAKAAPQRGGAGGRAGTMRHGVLLLTSLVPLVLAPRPADERGSPRRLGKDPGELAPGAWGAQLLGERAGERDLSGVWRQGVGRRWCVQKFSV